MTMILELPEKLEAALRNEAERRHVLPEELVLRALDRELNLNVVVTGSNPLSDLMKQWNAELEDPAAHESFDEVFEGIDAARVGQRKLFTHLTKDKE